MCAIKSPSTYPDCQMIPENQWKIDPMYSSCCNLFIKDVLELPPYIGSQENTFMYKNHPIRFVSVMGIVVKVEEKSQFFIYGVDDGTGVISCVCWKPKESENENVAVPSAQSLVERMERFHLEQLTCLQVGDLIHLRGKLRMYRDAMQISVFSYGQVIDPMHSFEVSHMDHQVTKYQRVYDVPFCISNHPDKAMESRKGKKTVAILAREAEDEVIKLSKEKHFRNFFLHELECIPEINQLCSQSCSEFDTVDKSMGKNLAPQVVAVLKEAIKNLLHKGLIFKSKREKGLHHLTLANKQLRKDVCHVLKKDCQKEQYLNGCHFLHIYDSVTNCDDFQCLTHVALRLLLNLLEQEGMIVSSSDHHYLPVT